MENNINIKNKITLILACFFNLNAEYDSKTKISKFDTIHKQFQSPSLKDCFSNIEINNTIFVTRSTAKPIIIKKDTQSSAHSSFSWLSNYVIGIGSRLIFGTDITRKHNDAFTSQLKDIQGQLKKTEKTLKLKPQGNVTNPNVSFQDTTQSQEPYIKDNKIYYLGQEFTCHQFYKQHSDLYLQLMKKITSQSRVIDETTSAPERKKESDQSFCDLFKQTRHNIISTVNTLETKGNNLRQNPKPLFQACTEDVNKLYNIYLEQQTGTTKCLSREAFLQWIFMLGDFKRLNKKINQELLTVYTSPLSSWATDSCCCRVDGTQFTL